jgi:hypothetical protein
MEVRAATEGEIDRLAAIWHQVWHEAHARIVPPDLTRIRTLDSFRDRPCGRRLETCGSPDPPASPRASASCMVTSCTSSSSPRRPEDRNPPPR